MKKQHISFWLKQSEDEILTQVAKEKSGYVNLYILRLLEDLRLEDLNTSDLRFLAKEGAVQKVFPVPDSYSENVNNFKVFLNIFFGENLFLDQKQPLQAALK